MWQALFVFPRGLGVEPATGCRNMSSASTANTRFQQLCSEIMAGRQMLVNSIQAVNSPVHVLIDSSPSLRLSSHFLCPVRDLNFKTRRWRDPRKTTIYFWCPPRLLIAQMATTSASFAGMRWAKCGLMFFGNLFFSLSKTLLINS